MSDTLLYDGLNGSTNATNVADSNNTCFVGWGFLSPGTRKPISKVILKLTKAAGSIAGKTFKVGIFFNKANTSADIDTRFAVSAGVTGSDAWSQTAVTFTFATPFWTDVGVNYAIVLFVDDGASDGANYANGYFDSNSVPIAAHIGVWKSDKTNFSDSGSFIYQLQVYVADAPAAAPWTVATGTDAGGQAYRVLVPASPNGRGIILPHSAQQTEYFAYWSSIYPTVVALLAAGFTIYESRAYGDNWGNQNAIDNSYVYGCALLRASYSVGNLGILSTSMGGVCGLLLYAQGNVANIKAWLGVSSVNDLAAAGTAGFSSDISTAYGGGSTSGHDPILLPASQFDGLAMRWQASLADTLITKAAHADAMASHVAGHASENTVVTTSGTHGALANFDTQDIVDFFVRTIGGSTAPAAGSGTLDALSGLNALSAI